MTRNARNRKNAELLIKQARIDPQFDGDFTALAERMGWTSGTFWRQNPAIRRAEKLWRKQ